MTTHEDRNTDESGRVTCERPWGRWTRVYFDGVLEVRKLEVKRGGFCTKHFHRTKINTFIVVVGTLQVRQWPDPRVVEDTDMRPAAYAGQALTVQPYIPHRFYGLTDAVVYEFALPVGCGMLDPEETEQLEPAGIE